MIENTFLPDEKNVRRRRSIHDIQSAAEVVLSQYSDPIAIVISGAVYSGNIAIQCLRGALFRRIPILWTLDQGFHPQEMEFYLDWHWSSIDTNGEHNIMLRTMVMWQGRTIKFRMLNDGILRAVQYF